jgi:hypothetical protein
MKKIIFISYSLTLIFLVIFSYAFVDQNLIYYKNIFSNFAFQNRFVTTCLYLLFLCILFGFYLLFIHLIRNKKINGRDIKFLLGTTCFILFFSYPAMLSYDIFNYLATAKVLFFYHENPYVVMPIEFIGDPMLLFTHAANKLALYGPGWILLTGAPFAIGFGSFLFTLIGFKLLNSIFYLLTIFLLWKLSKSFYPIVLFAFNPLVVIETLISNHNDIVMIFLLLFSLFLLKEKKYFGALFLFICSVSIKYATLIILPVILFIIWKTYNERVINWKKIQYVSLLGMLAIFFLSPLREEMYPWYAIWFLPFAALIYERKNIVHLSIAFSFGLMLRYVPFMYSGTHFGMTPYLRVILASLPVLIVGVSLLGRKVLHK